MSKTPPPRLGKGLSAILGTRKPIEPPTAPPVAPGEPPAAVPASSDASSSSQNLPVPFPTGVVIRELPIEQVVPNPRQPRSHFDPAALDELAGSIRANGVLQPVVVRATPAGGFELVAGERRLRAARQAGLASIPAIVRELSNEQSLEIALIENIQREDLSPLERSRAYQAYIDAFQVSAETLAERLGESRSSVVNYLRLLRLPAEIIEFIERGELGMGHARAIAGIPEIQRQVAVARLAVRRNLSARQVEDLARQGGDAVSRETATGVPSGVDRHFKHLQESIGKALGLRVRVMPGRKKNSGRLVIHYGSLEEFDRLSSKLGVSID